MSGLALRAGDRAHALPPGATPVPPPVPRAVPGGDGRLFVAFLGRTAVPAWLLPGAAAPGAAWVAAPMEDGAVLIGGDALLDPAPPDALPAERPRFPAAPPRLARPAEPPGPAAEYASRVPDVRLRIADVLLDIPLACVDALMPMPAIRPLAGAVEGVAGIAWTETGPILVLAPVDCEPAASPLLAVLTVEGRRLGLPCERFGVAPRGATLPDGLRDPGLLRHAPVALPPPTRPETPTRLLLLARVGASPVALAVEDVVAVLPPRDGGPPPRRVGALRGLVAHRGDVLPVLDLGEVIGARPVLRADLGVPMLRLSSAPVAVAVSSVGGLRAVPDPDVVAVPGEGPGVGMIAAHARVDGEPVPVLRGRAIAAALSRPVEARPMETRPMERRPMERRP